MQLADGTGRYQAVFLTTNNLVYDSGGGNFVSAFSAAEWATLFQYERDYKVRQVALYGVPDTFPEDYCVRYTGEQAVNNTDLPIRLTSTGAGVFNYLRPDAQIPLRFSYLYKGSLDAACAASNPTQAILQDGAGAVLGVRSTTRDGRERMMLQFSSNPFFFYTPMLSYGVVRWATRGLFIGERQHFLHFDIDDHFNSTDWRLANGTFAPNGFRLSASDLLSANTQANAFRTRFGSLLNNFNFSLAYNADGADTDAPNSCSLTLPTPDRLTSVTRCLASGFRWINHGFTHINLDKTTWAPYSVSRFEIQENLRVGGLLGLSTPANIFKPGELSGLGFFDPARTDPFGDIGNPQDFGLGASNTQFLQAARDSGVQIIHSNSSVASQRPPASCPNCGIVHPLNNALFLIPVRPNNVAFYVTTPAEEVSFFNLFYGPGGLFPTFSTNQNYTQIVNYNSEVAFFDLITGSAYAVFMHQGNLRQYATNRSLVFDWATALMDRYALYYRIPVRSLPWGGSASIASYIQGRTSHAALYTRMRGVWDRSANATGTVTLTAPSNASGRFFVSGGQTGSITSYGGDNIADINLAANQSVSFVPALRQ
jgi:hypothetical protein